MKLKSLFVLLLVISVGISCSEENEDVVNIPKGVMNQDQYARLLAELSMAEAAGNVNPKNLSGAKYDSAYSFDPVKDNNISKAIYDSTVNFYSKHPELFKKVCEDVLNILSQMQIARNARIDSIRRADSAAGPVFIVLLKQPGKNKDTVYKRVRDIKGLNKKDWKKLLAKGIDTVKQKITKTEADQIKSALEKEGAKVDIKKP